MTVGIASKLYYEQHAFCTKKTMTKTEEYLQSEPDVEVQICSHDGNSGSGAGLLVYSFESEIFFDYENSRNHRVYDNYKRRKYFV